MINTEAIERAILSSFMYSGEYYPLIDIKDIELDEDIFSYPQYKKIANLMNEIIKKGFSLTPDILYKALKLDKVATYSNVYLDLLSTTPFPTNTIKTYIKVLEQEQLKRLVNAA